MIPSLLLHIDTLDRGPVRLEGVLPAEVLELDSEVSIRNIGEVRYELLAEKKSKDILVRGSVEAPMELECSRSGLFFSTIVRDSAFLRDYSIPESNGSIDLTNDVREAVVLNIPIYPVSPEAQTDTFIPPTLPEKRTPPPATEGEAWKVLDNLNLDNP